MSFLDSKAEDGPERPLEASFTVALAGFAPCNKVGSIAGVTLIGS